MGHRRQNRALLPILGPPTRLLLNLTIPHSLSATTEIACQTCATGVCTSCQSTWNREIDGGGCVVCREKGEGWNITEYGEAEMREGVEEVVEEIRVILN